MKKNKYCCVFMSKFLKDSRVGIYYDPTIRLYTIFIPTSGSYQGIYNCPWCGHKLPYNLIDTYEETLKREYNIDDLYSRDQEKLIPEEFKTDEWWKNRNL